MAGSNALESKKLLWLALVLGLVLRLISINQSLWLDEATTALVARMSLFDIFSKFLPGDFHPPLYYLLIKIWVFFFGSSEVSLRLPSVIFGLGTVVFVYLISDCLFGKLVANIASFLTATSGLLIYYSQETRMYSLTTFLVAALFYFWVKRRWFWFSALVLALGLVDYLAISVILVFLVYEKNRKKLVLSLIPLVASYVLWLPIFLKQLYGGLSNVGNNWWNILGVLSFKNLALIPLKFVLGRISFDNKFLYFLVGIFSVFLFFYLFVRSVKKGKSVLLWFSFPILLGIIMSLKIPILYYFRFLFCLPAFYILVSVGLTSLKRPYFWVFLALVFLVNILSSIYYLSSYKFHREDWRTALEVIGDDPLIMHKNVHQEAVIYYGKEKNLTGVKEMGDDKKVVWLSRYVWEITDLEDSTRLAIEKLGFEKIEEHNFNGVVLWKYEK